MTSHRLAALVALALLVAPLAGCHHGNDDDHDRHVEHHHDRDVPDDAQYRGHGRYVPPASSGGGGRY